MSRQSLFVVNTIMAILVTIQAITGIRLSFIDIIGWEESEMWMDVHLINGLCLLVLIAIHIYLNRNWIKAQFAIR